MSGEFESRKDSQSIKFKQRPQMFIKLKLPRYFTCSWRSLLVTNSKFGSLYYQGAQWNQKTPIPVSSRWQVRAEKGQKRISINTNHSYHQHIHLPKPVSSDLTIKPDSVLTNAIGKDWVQSWSI